MFYVGQKVARDGGNDDCEAATPANGEVCTITSISQMQGYTLLTVAEYPIPNVPGRLPRFDAKWFRPVAERKTDISIFTKMLTPNQRETERVS